MTRVEELIKQVGAKTKKEKNMIRRWVYYKAKYDMVVAGYRYVRQNMFLDDGKLVDSAYKDLKEVAEREFNLVKNTLKDLFPKVGW